MTPPIANEPARVTHPLYELVLTNVEECDSLAELALSEALPICSPALAERLQA